MYVREKPFFLEKPICSGYQFGITFDTLNFIAKVPERENLSAAPCADDEEPLTILEKTIDHRCFPRAKAALVVAAITVFVSRRIVSIVNAEKGLASEES